MNTFRLSTLGVSCLLVLVAGCGGSVDSGGESEVQDQLAIPNPLDSVIAPRIQELEYNAKHIFLGGPVDLQPTPDRVTHLNRHLFHTTSWAVHETRENRYLPIPNEFCPSDMAINAVDSDGGSSDCPECAGYAQDIQLAPLSFGAKNLLAGYAGRFRIELVRKDETNLEYRPVGGNVPNSFPREQLVATTERQGLMGGGSATVQYDPQTTVRVWSFPYIDGLPLGSCFVWVNWLGNPVYQEDDYILTVDTLNQVQETLENNNSRPLLN